jgi:excisionase family DNA binding protein
MTFEPLLTVPEAASLLRIHPKTVQAMCRSRALPAFRLGREWRFRTSVLDQWVLNSLDQPRARE